MLFHDIINQGLILIVLIETPGHRSYIFDILSVFNFFFLSLDPNDQKSLEGMQKMEKEESPTDATVELDGDDMEGSGEDGDLEGSDSEAAQWADQEQWFGMQWPRATEARWVSTTF